jgi:hypothetical protein
MTPAGHPIWGRVGGTGARHGTGPTPRAPCGDHSPATTACRMATGGAEPRWFDSVPAVRSLRRCSRNGCPRHPVATLTYVYAESTAVVGPLAAFAEPHSYDLCEVHARSLTAPRGWDLVRHDGDFAPPPPTNDDLVALAEAVREAARPSPRAGHYEVAAQVGRRGHLRVIPPTG